MAVPGFPSLFFVYGPNTNTSGGSIIVYLEAQAAYIRQRSGRTFTELSGTPTVFRFERGQRCFAEHRTRPARFLAGGIQVASLAAWVGDLDQHVQNLEDQARKG